MWPGSEPAMKKIATPLAARMRSTTHAKMSIMAKNRLRPATVIVGQGADLLGLCGFRVSGSSWTEVQCLTGNVRWGQKRIHWQVLGTPVAIYWRTRASIPETDCPLIWTCELRGNLVRSAVSYKTRAMPQFQVSTDLPWYSLIRHRAWPGIANRYASEAA